MSEKKEEGINSVFMDRDTYSSVRLHSLGTTGMWCNEMGDIYEIDLDTRWAKRKS